MTMTDTIMRGLDERLAELQLSPHQEQAVRDLIGEFASLFEAEKQVNILEQHFGGTEKWRVVARQIETWAKKALPERVHEALSTTAEGVFAMHRMMISEQPAVVRPRENELKQMMRDPRYWRDLDPEFVERVREGFRELYRDRDGFQKFYGESGL
jgi:hypothetical protein